MEKGRTESRSFQSFNPSLVPALGSCALSPHPQTSSLWSPPSPALYRFLMQAKPKALNPLRKKSFLCPLSLFARTFFFPPISSSLCYHPRLETFLGAAFPASSVPTSTAPSISLSISKAVRGMHEPGEGSPAGNLAKFSPGHWQAGRYHHVPQVTKPLPMFSVQSGFGEDLSEVQRAAVLSVAAGYL